MQPAIPQISTVWPSSAQPVSQYILSLTQNAWINSYRQTKKKILSNITPACSHFSLKVWRTKTRPSLTVGCMTWSTASTHWIFLLFHPPRRRWRRCWSSVLMCASECLNRLVTHMSCRITLNSEHIFTHHVWRLLLFIDSSRPGGCTDSTQWLLSWGSVWI